MAYSAITNAEIDPDSPITTSLMTKIRDNPEGIATNATGATEVNGAAITDNTVSGVKLNDASVTGDKLEGPAAGNYALGGGASEFSTTSTSLVKVAEFYIRQPGAIRTRIKLNNPGSGTSIAQVYKNGVAAGTSRSNSGASPSYFSEDFSSLVEGDLIQLYARNTTGGDSSSGKFALGTTGDSGHAYGFDITLDV